jgi:hypothetical protein
MNLKGDMYFNQFIYILLYSGTPEKIVPSVTKVENDLKGYMHMLVISAKGNSLIV